MVMTKRYDSIEFSTSEGVDEIGVRLIIIIIRWLPVDTRHAPK